MRPGTDYSTLCTRLRCRIPSTCVSSYCKVTASAQAGPAREAPPCAVASQYKVHARVISDLSQISEFILCPSVPGVTSTTGCAPGGFGPGGGLGVGFGPAGGRGVGFAAAAAAAGGLGAAGGAAANLA